jgi:hypothetical protein
MAAGLPGSLPPDTYTADPDTVRLRYYSPPQIPVDIRAILVTIFPPNIRERPYARATLRNQRAEGMTGTWPRLPRPGPPRPNPGSPVHVQLPLDDILGFRLDDTLWRHALDDSLSEIQDSDIACTLVTSVRQAVQPEDISGFTWVWEWISWYLFQDTSIFGQPSSTDSPPRRPITDCSYEASTSGTKDKNDELRR